MRAIDRITIDPGTGLDCIPVVSADELTLTIPRINDDSPALARFRNARLVALVPLADFLPPDADPNTAADIAQARITEAVRVAEPGAEWLVCNPSWGDWVILHDPEPLNLSDSSTALLLWSIADDRE